MTVEVQMMTSMPGPRRRHRRVSFCSSVGVHEPGARVITARTHNLSEGGMCLSTRATFTAGERLGVRVELPGTGMVTARVIVRSVETPREGMRNRRVHCQFINVDREASELIVQYLLRRQRELRARGQL